ncbi:c-type cytochrome [Pantoea eucrina]|uniref:Cytochrome c n=1 Tax=Pantoea eucrina TaxID=472693 RepID=A0ABS1Z633_9GAMM|nr:cytochrome c [Pantoea eucrina]AIX50328.1 cytochrome C554 [Pantoea sp. PSNIH1]MBM0747884.1 cytochrome c [Pantoea eucrina]UBB13821.1 cytochrome c [Pantoea eucrina]
MRHWLTAVLCFVSLPLWAEGDAAAGAEKAARCMACHGAEGKSAIPLYPHLAGQQAPYLAHALHAYQKGERSGGQAEVMKAFVAGLSDSDIEDLAAYYSGLKP